MGEFLSSYNNLVSRALWPRLLFTCNESMYDYVTTIPFRSAENQLVTTTALASKLLDAESINDAQTLPNLKKSTYATKHALYNECFASDLVFERQLASFATPQSSSQSACLATVLSNCGLELNEDPVGDGSCLFGAMSASLLLPTLVFTMNPKPSLQQQAQARAQAQAQTLHHRHGHAHTIFGDGATIGGATVVDSNTRRQYHQSRVVPLKNMCAQTVMLSIDSAPSHASQVDLRAGFLSDRTAGDNYGDDIGRYNEEFNCDIYKNYDGGDALNGADKRFRFSSTPQTHPLRTFENFCHYVAEIVMYTHRKLVYSQDHEHANTRSAIQCLGENGCDNPLVKRLYSGYRRRYDFDVAESERAVSGFVDAYHPAAGNGKTGANLGGGKSNSLVSTSPSIRPWTFTISPYIDPSQWQKSFIQWLTTDDDVMRGATANVAVPRIIHFDPWDAHVDPEIELSGFFLSGVYMDMDTMGGEMECHYLAKALDTPIVCIDWDASPTMSRYIGREIVDNGDGDCGGNVSNTPDTRVQLKPKGERLYARPHSLLDVVFRTHIYMCDDQQSHHHTRKEGGVNMPKCYTEGGGREAIYVMRVSGHYLSLRPSVDLLQVPERLQAQISSSNTNDTSIPPSTIPSKTLVANFTTLCCLDRDRRDITDERTATFGVIARNDGSVGRVGGGVNNNGAVGPTAEDGDRAVFVSTTTLSSPHAPYCHFFPKVGPEVLCINDDDVSVGEGHDGSLSAKENLTCVFCQKQAIVLRQLYALDLCCLQHYMQTWMFDAEDGEEVI